MREDVSRSGSPMRPAARRVGLLLVVFIGWTAPVLAQPVPVGAQFQVYTYPGYLTTPAVATDQAGNFVVVWERYSAGYPSGLTTVTGQRYAADGNPTGGEFQVNTYTVGYYYGISRPAVGSDADGNFIVVWLGRGATGSSEVQGQRYAADGNPLGSQFQINTYTTGHPSSPAVATDSDGDFVVVWTSPGSSGSDTSSTSIQGQRFAASGSPSGSEFQVNSYTTDAQIAYDVAMDPDGNFVVVWTSTGSGGSDTSGSSIQGQRFAADGSLSGSQFQVNSYTSGSQRFPTVAMDADGFVVVWKKGSGSSGRAALGKRFAADGNPIGSEFEVSSDSSTSPLNSDVVTDPEGGFVVVWQTHVFSTSYSRARGRRFAANGDPIGADFQVDSAPSYEDQDLPAVAAGPNNTFVVVWHGYLSGITGRRFEEGGTVGDRVWRDLDLDGLQDPGEPGVEGVTVNLFDDLGTYLWSTASDAQGLFSIVSPVGEHYLQFELPSSLSFTLADQSLDDAIDSDADVLTGETDTFIVVEDGNDTTWDAGMANGIGDLIWFDSDGDGIQDAGEPGVAGASVSLYENAGPLVGTTTSDADGFYSFQDLPAGEYYLVVTLPSGLSATLPNATSDDLDSDIDELGSTATIDLSQGELEANWDAGLVELDYGDANDPTFPTLLASNGARHRIVTGFRLGSSVDAESDGHPTAAANGDDVAGGDDEDGLAFPSPLVAGTSPSVTVTASAFGLLDAWLDLNRDGDWSDPGEQVLASAAVAAGANTPSLPIPSSAVEGETYGRFRFSSAGGLSFDGLAADGEVEDYRLTLEREGDLGVVLRSSSPSAVAGLELDYVATITDHGPSDVTGVHLTVTLPLGVTLLSTDPLAPTCDEIGIVVTCTLGALAASASTEVTLTVLVDSDATGMLGTSAVVARNETDPVPGNDSTTLNTPVEVPLFADSFENGDTTAWSTSQP